MTLYGVCLSRFLLSLRNMNPIVLDSVKEYVNVLRFNRGRCASDPTLKSTSSFGYSGTNAHILAASDEWCKHLGTTDMELLWHRLEFNEAEDSGSPMMNMRGQFLHLKGLVR